MNRALWRRARRRERLTVLLVLHGDALHDDIALVANVPSQHRHLPLSGIPESSRGGRVVRCPSAYPEVVHLLLIQLDSQPRSLERARFTSPDRKGLREEVFIVIK